MKKSSKYGWLQMVNNHQFLESEHTSHDTIHLSQHYKILFLWLELRCRVMLQKETAERYTDQECDKTVQEGHAGLCE